MSEFQLKLDIIAEIDQLRAELTNAENEIHNKMGRWSKYLESKSSESGMRSGKAMGSSIVRGLGAAVGIGTVVKIISGTLDAAARDIQDPAARAGKTAGHYYLEAFVTQLQQIPVVGSVGTIIGGMLGAFDFEHEQHRREQNIEAAKKENDIISRNAQRMREVIRLGEEKLKLEQEALEAKRQAEQEERTAVQRSLRDSEAAFTTTISSLETEQEILELREKGDERGILLAQQRLELTQSYWGFESKIESARRSGNKELEERLEKHRDLVKAQKEMNHQLEIEAFDREEAARKAEEAAAIQEEFANKRLQAEKEIAEARERATAAANSATATFSTAGGSFTASAVGVVDEAKLLRDISEDSRDYLAQIVANTARAGISLL